MDYEVNINRRKERSIGDTKSGEVFIYVQRMSHREVRGRDRLSVMHKTGDVT